MKLHEMKSELANLMGLSEKSPCSFIVNEVKRSIARERSKRVKVQDQIDELNDRINDLHGQLCAERTKVSAESSERQRLEDRILKISARFEVIYEIIDSIDDIR